MTLELEPLPGDVAHLLSRGASQLEPSAHTRRRLRRRLAAEVQGQGGPLLALAPRQSLESLAGRVLRNRLLIGLASFALGAGTSSFLHSAGAGPFAPLTASPSVPPAPGSPLAVASHPAPIVAAASAPSQVSQLRHRPRAVVAVRPTPAVASTAPLATELPKSELRLEGELLERGRIAMVRGDAEGALEAADEHAMRFPSGRLTEEREALRVQVLVSDGRLPEAREVLSSFRRAYPKSLAGSALEAAVAGR